MKFTRPLLILTILSLFFLGAGGASPASAQGPLDTGPRPSFVDQTGDRRDGMTLTLSADSAARPGETVSLTLAATPFLDAPSLKVHWALPDGVELVSGGTDDQLGRVATGETVSSTRDLRFTAAGTHKIAAEVTYAPYENVQYSASGVLFYIVDPRNPQVSDLEPGAGDDMFDPIPVTNVIRQSYAVQPNAVTADPCFDVSGSLFRIDKPITAGGYGTDVNVPVAGHYVELRESDILFDDTLSSTYTEEDGSFTFPRVCDNDGLFDDTLELYIEIYSANDAAWVTDSTRIDEGYTYVSDEVSSGGGTLTFNLQLNETQSAVFNILDAATDALDFWYLNDADKKEMPQVQIHWEPGYGDDGSFYVGFWDEITIADDPSDPDEWDDPVIIHEWGHFADDKRGCDDSPGGAHNVTGTYDVELAFGEGYPDYYQAAVRAWRGDAGPGNYVDVSGTGGLLFVDLESPRSAIQRTQRNEFAIAAALWDLQDATNDGQDTVSLTHEPLHSVYTWHEFTNQGFFDDDCDFENYLRAWVDAGKPADAATAAAISQNVADTTLPASLMVNAIDMAPTSADTTVVPTDVPEYRWWNRAGFIVDNSPSMAGTKLDAVKSAINTQADDYSAEAEGTEFDLYTFNEGSAELDTVFEGQFFPSAFSGSIAGLAAGGTDNGCTVDALSALGRAAEKDSRARLWLYTDGDAVSNSPFNAVSQLLTDRASSASFVLLGGCTTVANALPTLAAGTPLPQATTLEAVDGRLAERRSAAQRSATNALLGANALSEPSDGIVPYLLTALNTGGQFLYVGESRLGDAADILQAQLTHSAGAGRWSDYVSESATYQYDSLASWEFDWIDATDGTNWGQAGDGFSSTGVTGSEGRTTVLFSLSDPAFDYYGDGQFGAQVYENGYLVVGGNAANEAAVAGNVQIPNAATPNFAVYPLWDDLEWDNRIFDDNNGGYLVLPGYEDYGSIYTKKVGDWHVVQWYGFGLASNVVRGGQFQPEEFQVLFNEVTGEIRIQYGDVTGEAPDSATIGIEDAGATDASVQVAYNNPSAVTDNSGYKFVPVPPQPTRTYTVTVDATMDSVGFLLTGYSGSFDDLVVRDPGGTAVDCADTVDVLCLLDLDPANNRVQYVQVDTNGRTGDWTATVGAGPTGSGTFSFTSLGASPISPESVGDRTHSTADLLDLVVDLGDPTDGGTLTGYFRTPSGAPFGTEFTLYDDGAHGDGKAGDGRFGATGFTPPGAGTAFLWMSGAISGTSFVRSDPAPYSFQPVSYTSLGDAVNTGGQTTLQFSLRNDDSVEHCYYFDITVPEGWWYDVWDGFFRCVPAGESIVHPVDVRMNQDETDDNNDRPSGATGTVTVAAIEFEKGEITDSASATVTRRRAPAAPDLYAPQREVRPGGDTAPLRAYVLDDQDTAVADGTIVTFTTTLGSVPATATVLEGVAEVLFTSGAAEGSALVTVETPNGLTDSETILIQDAPPDGLSLTAAPAGLSPDETEAALTATVTDTYGLRVAGALVRIGVEGDGQIGTISGGNEVITGTTNAVGQVVGTFERVAATGQAGIRAELLSPDGAGGYRVAREDRLILTLGSHTVFLPLAIKN